MAKRQSNTKNSNDNAFSLLSYIGSNSGTFISLCTVAGILVAVSAYATTVIKNIEILDLKKEFSIKEIEYKSKISELEYDIKVTESKISEYEKRRK